MSSAPAVIPFYGEGAGRLFTIHHDVMHACGNRPMHDPHVKHDPPCRAFNAGCGEAQRTENYCGKNPPRLPAHRSGPGPTTRRAYVWPRPGGSCRCTKVGALLLTPLLVRGQSEPRARHDHTQQGKGGEPEHKTVKATPRPETPKSKRARWTSPGRTLAGAAAAAPARALPGRLAQHQQSAPPLSPRVPTPSTTLEPRLGRHLH